MKSRLFTQAELKELEERKKGNYADKTGIYSSRIKPKLLELLNYWFPKLKELKKLVEVKK